MKLQVAGDFARFARTIVGGGLKSIRIFTELNTPIPTKNEKNLTNIVLSRNPSRAHDFTNIRTCHIASSATETILG